MIEKTTTSPEYAETGIEFEIMISRLSDACLILADCMTLSIKVCVVLYYRTLLDAHRIGGGNGDLEKFKLRQIAYTTSLRTCVWDIQNA